jgi:hypothetical protein
MAGNFQEDQMKIWALFSIDNEYDQPRNNLIAWWIEKPDPKTLMDLDEFKQMFERKDKFDRVSFFQNLCMGKEVEDLFYTEYRLKEIKEGEVE